MSVAVVVGGGFSGVVAARELLRTGWTVVMVDPGLSPGRGLAYSTSAPWHLLNAPVSGMSVDPDRPNGFLDWCRQRDPGAAPADFVPRAWYGDYLTEALRGADTVAPGRLTVQRGRVARIFESSAGAPAGPLTVLLDDDVVIPAARVVLALGHAVPTMPGHLDARVRSSAAYVADPWRPGALDGIGEGPVLLIGTGLTAVDVAMSLTRAGRTELVAASRHGLLPQPHRPAGQTPAQVGPIAPELLPTGSLAALTRSLRLLAERVGDWRAVMDALRPHWDVLWQRLPEADQQRFLRHLARYWEVHRHRMAPPVAAEVAGLLADGRLRIRAAELCGLSVYAEPPATLDPAHPAIGGGVTGLRAVLRERGGRVTAQRFAAVVNCTGPGRLVDSDPLVRSLIADGMARSGPYGLGVDVNEHGAAVGRDGRVGRGTRPAALYVIGPPRRGRLWETTAAPEIRAQARALAEHLRPFAAKQEHATGVAATS